MVAGSALKPSALVVLRAEGVEGLKASKPEDWEVLAVTTTLEVCLGALLCIVGMFCVHCL